MSFAVHYLPLQFEEYEWRVFLLTLGSKSYITSVKYVQMTGLAF